MILRCGLQKKSGERLVNKRLIATITSRRYCTKNADGSQMNKTVASGEWLVASKIKKFF
jgi:hypothetical protein